MIFAAILAVPSKYLIVLAGPTAVGKTALSIHLAKHLDTEIISADSRQFFKELSIGTARPTKEEMQNIPHHFVGNISITVNYHAAQFEIDALKEIENIFRKNKTVILTGGSGLYIDAVCKGFDELPVADDSIRKKLKEEFEELGIKALQEKLLNCDPEYYKQVDINNPQRIMRALEVFEASGKPYSSFRTEKGKNRNFKIIKIGLDRSREELYNRINKRVDEMIPAGLEEEAKSVLPYKNKNALQTVGYKEMFEYFEGMRTLEETINLIKQNTRRYAKRQLTWFRKDKEIKWFHPDKESEIKEYIHSIIDAQPTSELS